MRFTRSALLIASVALFALPGCHGTRVDDADSQLAANIEAFSGELAGRDEFSGVVLLSRHGNALVRR